MSTPINTGGPAFPHVNPNYDGLWDKEPQRGGMTMRDWFAGQAIAEAGANLRASDSDGCDVEMTDGSILEHGHDIFDCPKSIARVAYDIADAMIAARSKKEGA